MFFWLHILGGTDFTIEFIATGARKDASKAKAKFSVIESFNIAQCKPVVDWAEEKNVPDPDAACKKRKGRYIYRRYISIEFFKKCWLCCYPNRSTLPGQGGDQSYMLPLSILMRANVMTYVHMQARQVQTHKLPPTESGQMV